MLKRIEPGDVELGMFIQKLEGSFLSHPFWRVRFLLTDENQLRKLRDSAVEGVVIDTARGRDVAPQEPEPAASRKPAAPSPLPAARRRNFAPAPAPRPSHAPAATHENFDLRSTAPQSIAREFGHAVAVADRSRKAVSRMFLEARLGKSIKAGLVEPVVNDIFASVQRNPHAFNGLMRCKRDNEELYRHALAVSALMITLGRQLKLRPDEIKAAGQAGLLHDVGIGHLPVDLTAVGGDYRRIDPAILHGHVQLGYDLLCASGTPAAVTRACLEHHERIDGDGYPNGVQGGEISLLGRMAAVCDSYDELANDADGAPGHDPAAALDAMRGMAGAFDPTLLDALVDALGVYPVGSLVLLRSGRLAMVVNQSRDDVSKPTVRAFYSVASRTLLQPSDVALATCYGEDAIEAVARAEQYGIADLPALRERLLQKPGRAARATPASAAPLAPASQSA